MSKNLYDDIEKCVNFDDTTKKYTINYLKNNGYIKVKILKNYQNFLNSLQFIKNIKIEFIKIINFNLTAMYDYSFSNSEFKLYKKDDNYYITRKFKKDFIDEVDDGTDDIIIYKFNKEPTQILLENILILEKYMIKLIGKDNTIFQEFNEDIHSNYNEKIYNSSINYIVLLRLIII